MTILDDAIKANTITGATVEYILEDTSRFFELLNKNLLLTKAFAEILTRDETQKLVKGTHENVPFFMSLIDSHVLTLPLKEAWKKEHFDQFIKYIAPIAILSEPHGTQVNGDVQKPIYIINNSQYRHFQNHFLAYQFCVLEFMRIKMEIVTTLIENLEGPSDILNSEFTGEANLLQKIWDHGCNYETFEKIIGLMSSDVLLSNLLKTRTINNLETDLLQQIIVFTPADKTAYGPHRSKILLKICDILGMFNATSSGREKFEEILSSYPQDLLKLMKDNQPKILVDFFIISPRYFIGQYRTGYKMIMADSYHAPLIKTVEQKELSLEPTEKKYTSLKEFLKQRREPTTKLSGVATSSKPAEPKTVGSNVLYKAIHSTHANELETLLLQESTDPNMPIAYGNNATKTYEYPLCTAIGLGKDAAVQALLNHKKTDPNLRSTHSGVDYPGPGEAPLFQACVKGLYSIALMLAQDARINPNATTSRLTTDNHVLSLLISRFSNKEVLNKQDKKLLELLLTNAKIDFVQVTRNNSWYPSYLEHQVGRTPLNAFFKDSKTFPEMCRMVSLAQASHDIFSGLNSNNWLNDNAIFNESTKNENDLVKKIITNHLKNKSYPNQEMILGLFISAQDFKENIRAIKIELYIGELSLNGSVNLELLEKMTKEEKEKIRAHINKNPIALTNLLGSFTSDTQWDKINTVVDEEMLIDLLKTSDKTGKFLALPEQPSLLDALKITITYRLRCYLTAKTPSSHSTLTQYNTSAADIFYEKNLKPLLKPLTAYCIKTKTNGDSTALEKIIEECLKDIPIIVKPEKQAEIETKLTQEFGAKVSQAFSSHIKSMHDKAMNNSKNLGIEMN